MTFVLVLQCFLIILFMCSLYYLKNNRRIANITKKKKYIFLLLSNINTSVSSPISLIFKRYKGQNSLIPGTVYPVGVCQSPESLSSVKTDVRQAIEPLSRGKIPVSVDICQTCKLAEFCDFLGNKGSIFDTKDHPDPHILSCRSCPVHSKCQNMQKGQRALCPVVSLSLCDWSLCIPV